jgi:hypothetical protein
MVFCCFEPQGYEDETVTAYPGGSRFTKTSGIAMLEDEDSVEDDQQKVLGTYKQRRCWMDGRLYVSSDR